MKMILKFETDVNSWNFQNVTLESGDPRSPVYQLYRELQFLLVSIYEKGQFQIYREWWFYVLIICFIQKSITCFVDSSKFILS